MSTVNDTMMEKSIQVLFIQPNSDTLPMWSDLALRSEFYMIGFYMEDKRRSVRSFIVECLLNSYNDSVDEYGAHDNDSLWMEREIMKYA